MENQNPFIYNQDLSNIEIILCRVSHSGNIGSIARAMKVMGLTRLILVQPLCLLDDLSYAMAAHAADILNNVIILNSLPAALASSKRSIAFSARNRIFTRRTDSVRKIFSSIKSDLVSGSRISLVFGNEQHGLSMDELECCEMLAVIPTNHPTYSSLNLSQAVQIACYELNSQFEHSVSLDRDLHVAAEDQVSWSDALYLLARIEAVLTSKNFYKRDKAQALKQNLKNILYKAQLTRDELNLLHGIFKHLGT